ncbi:MAG: hypothetical protein ACOWWH_07155 [Eubacteriaceae bacterium]
MYETEVMQLYDLIQAAYPTMKDLNEDTKSLWFKALINIDSSIATKAFEIYFMSDTKGAPRAFDIIKYSRMVESSPINAKPERKKIDCPICEGKGWILIDKDFYREIELSDGQKKKYYAGSYNTVYNCTCKNNKLNNIKSYRDANIDLNAYEKDYAGRYMRRRSAS